MNISLSKIFIFLIILVLTLTGFGLGEVKTVEAATNVCGAQIYEYTLTVPSSARIQPAGHHLGSAVSCSSPGSGWELSSSYCLLSNGGTCYSASCLWRKPSSQPRQYSLSGKGGNYGSHNDCTSLAPSGYTYAGGGCTSYWAGSNTCANMACLWSKNETSFSEDLTLGHQGAAVAGSYVAGCNTESKPGYALKNHMYVRSAGPGKIISDLCLFTKQNQCTLVPQCSDSIDNDNDGLVDYPNDPGCSDGQDDDESNATITNITCTSNSDCGTNAFVGGPYCQGNGVYRDFRTYTCNNPGTVSSSCSNSVSAQLQQTCSSNQTCSGGSCVNNQTPTINLSANPTSITQNQTSTLTWNSSNATSCQWTSGLTGVAGLSGFTTVSPNSTTNYSISCSNSTNSTSDSVTIGVLPSNNGGTCNTNSDCGTNGFVGGNYCQNNAVYRDFRTYTCNNPNSSNSSCQSNVSAQLQTVCSGNQTCNGGTCTTNVFPPTTNQNPFVSKEVRNLSTGNLNWSNSMSASPSDILQFRILIQAPSTNNLNTITVRDSFPQNLIYNGNLTIGGVLSNQNITQGITLTNIASNQTREITYQAQVAPLNNFPFGTSTLTNSVFVSGQNVSQASSSANVTVTRSGVLGAATTVPTGAAGDFIKDYFFIPILLVLATILAWRFGLFNNLNPINRIKVNRLNQKIASIRNRDNL